MKQARAIIAKKLTIISIITINILVIILMISWSNYVENYKQDTSSNILSIVKLSITNTDDINSMGKACTEIIKYIDAQPNRTIEIYDNHYNLHNVFSYIQHPDDFNINDYPNLMNSLKQLTSGHKVIKINDHDEEVFWDRVVTKDGSEKLLLVYGMIIPADQFSFVFIIAFLLIIFMLMLSASIYISNKNDYLSSLIKLSRLSYTNYGK